MGERERAEGDKRRKMKSSFLSRSTTSPRALAARRGVVVGSPRLNTTSKRTVVAAKRGSAEGRRSRQRVTGHERPGHFRHWNPSVSGGPRGPRSDGPELGLECCQQRLSYQRLQPLLQQDRAVREESGKGELG